MTRDLLHPDALEQALSERSAWSVNAARTELSRTLTFDGFASAFACMTAVALEAQALDHHPDWSNSWATVKITLSTHSAGGLTELDLKLAAAIDAHAARLGATPSA